MKVVHIITGLDIGGAELMLKRLVEPHHGRTDYQHSVISLTDIGEVGQQLKNQGISVEAMGMRSSLSVFLILWRLTRMLRVMSPDIVQTWMYHADLLGGLAARFAANRNVIWGVRTTDVRAGGSTQTAVVRRLCAWLSYRVPHTIICAAEASRQVHQSLGYDATKMTVVQNGFDMSRLTSTPEQALALRVDCGCDEKDILIGSIGRFHPVKDHKNFIDAAAILGPRFPQLRFLMVGRDLDPDNAQLTLWIKQTGFADRFVILGQRSDIPVCLSAIDIYCLHSRTEGFPNVLGEAMAMGVPCVTTDVGDAAVLIGDCGEVVPKADSASLAGGVEKLLELTASERMALGLKGKIRIKDNFSLSRTREQFELLYSKVIDRNVR
jgi:glycosyltransferase involved in cell wall biosynthesis